MINLSANPPKVFISYSHDSQKHKDLVLSLTNRLLREGIDCHIDQYEEFSPIEGWPRWMMNQLEWANFVLVVCTETYNRRFRGLEDLQKGRGATWEGAIITQKLYDDQVKNTQLIPIIFSDMDEKHIPIVIRSFNYYKIDTENGYEKLYRHLTNQPLLIKPSLGKLRKLEVRKDQKFIDEKEGSETFDN